MILFSEFEFSHDGYVSLVISSVTATSTSSRPDPSRIGFVLQSLKARNGFEFLQNTICALDFKLNTVLFTFQDLPHNPQSSFNKTYPVTYPGMYSLFFVNCNDESVLICAGLNLYFVKVTGTPQGLDVLFYTFQFIRTVLLFTLIVFIGSGWCIWKPFLEGKEKLVLMIVILLQVLANVFSILAWKAGPNYNEERMDWTNDSLGMNIFSCFAIFIPMACSSMSLKENHEIDGDIAVMNGVKLRLFGFAVFVHVVFTTVFVPAFFIPWVTYEVEEISLLVLCMVMFYIYRPSDDDDDRKAVEMAACKSGVPTPFLFCHSW
ncbi:hypothetical protein L1887_34305 [Cichorium endivia]|nr:hypothetical protein L1887_34305 [Cichorium endivia]